MLDLLETETGMYIAVSLALLLLAVLLIAFLSWRQRRQKKAALQNAVILEGATTVGKAVPVSSSIAPALPTPAVLSHALVRAMMAANYQTPQWQGTVPASSLSDDDLCFMEATAETVPWSTWINGEWGYICGRMNQALAYRMPTFTPDAYNGPLKTYSQP